VNNLSPEKYRERMNLIIAGEVDAINRTFAGTRPGRATPAKTSINRTAVAGRSFIAYRLTLDPTVLPQDIEKYLSKLQDALYRLRNHTGTVERPVTVRLRYSPLALEVNHPAPEPLDSSKANTQLAPDTMLVGRNYSGGTPTEDTVSLAGMAHVLAVGMTGSGKTTMLRMMIGSLALNTDPANLRMFIVDPKAEDFLAFKRLPHCEMFAGRREITQAIARVRAILAERQDIEGRFNGPRVVLFLDELSQVQDPVAIRQLNDLMAVGRAGDELFEIGPMKRFVDGSRRPEATLGGFFQERVHERFERRGQRGIDISQARRSLEQRLGHDTNEVRGGERQTPGQAFE